ncbi:hypothetical protein [Brevundimonas sp.]|uniref:hypothetical protein n=1 Tax=Brevundimonas sp. TaxID=1871086 RepID=UPI002D743586|nr:hypothetical protein [Brevundimonas sp.]HYC75014.1 hypothetical protein [Brevundimonas sp.]
MRTALLAAALLALAACGRNETAAPTEPAEPAPIPSKPPLVEPPETPAAASPGRLTLVDASGAPALHLSCDDRPGAIVIHVPGFEPIGSEDRLTLGAGDEAFAFVADLEASGPGVTAGGAPEADLFARMARGEPVRAVYGAQSVGPARAATPAALRAFVARCGGLRDR